MSSQLNDTPSQETANRRIKSLARHLALENARQALRFTVCTSKGDSEVSIRDDYTSITLGDVTMKVEAPQRPELVPTIGRGEMYGYALPLPELLGHLEWMMKKLQLGQDMFLIGPPGPVRRWLAFRFCQLLKREMEFQSLTSDTTESDLKQRREIRDKTIHYVDQAAVRAALHGRILILDGIEKCERNVLPILNNLLENREMHLEDGRFLVSPKRYAHLLKTNSETDLRNKLRLVPVHPGFQVIALGLPIPKFEGNALDPPLRSRFQARNIAPLAEQTQITLIKSMFPNFHLQTIAQLVAFAESLQRVQHSEEGALIPRLLQLPATALVDFVQFFARFPHASQLATLMRLYPYFAKSNEAERKAIEASLTSVGLIKKSSIAHDPSEIANATSGASVEALQRSAAEFIADPSYRIVSITPVEGQNGQWKVSFVNSSSSAPTNPAPTDTVIFGGPVNALKVKQHHVYVETESTRQLLVGLVQDHSLDFDLCIVGEQGSGKTQLISQFARILRYNVRTMQLYKDMTARDLLQKRTTNERGDTVWQNSPLVEAAIHGDLAVLDGIHRLAPGTLCVLQQLISDREIALYDGTRLMRRTSLLHLMKMTGLSEEKLKAQGINVIHPAFRIVALANPPDRHKPWLSSEIVSMFHFHLLSGVSLTHKFDILQALFPPLRGLFSSRSLEDERRKLHTLFNQSSSASSAMTSLGTALSLPTAASRLLLFVSSLADLRNRKMDTDESGNSDSDVPIFSLRQLIRTCQRITAFPSDLSKVVENVLLYKFFPLVLKESIGNVLLQCGIPPRQYNSPALASLHQGAIEASQPTGIAALASLSLPSSQPSQSVLPTPPESYSIQAPLEIKVTESEVSIGTVTARRNVPTNPALVPRIVFFEIPAHTELLQDMLKDWILKEHMLLIGNQGVGKNVLVDRMLELLRVEREYIQLHRDTTVQTLTLAPSIVNGVVVWEDSALVRAAKFGRTLVIDEADKAPLEVVCVLKGLIEDSEMLLADGRRIVALHTDDGADSNSAHGIATGKLIPMHPEFRVIVLANRPGFPFLGNNFFRECGDCFSVHVVDNPDRDSELRLLRSYAPHVDVDILDRLVNLFGDLREMVDQGQLTYPYSLRELVNIVKHMEAFPSDSLLQGIDNVFHFDQYDSVIKEHLTGVFQRHGLPVGGLFDFAVKLAAETQLPPAIPSEKWAINYAKPLTSSGAIGNVTITPLTKKGEWRSPTGSQNAEFKLRRPPVGRLKTFKEEKTSFIVESPGTLEGATAGKDGTIFVLVTKPLQLLAYSPKTGYRTYRVIRLSDHLQTHHPRYHVDRGVELMPTTVTTLRTGHIMVFIANFNMIMVVDPSNDTIVPYELPSATNHFSVFGRRAYITDHVHQALLRSPAEISSSTSRLIMVDTLCASEGIAIFPRLRSSDFFWVDFLTGKVGYSVLPIQMQIISLYPLTRTIWVLTGQNNTRFFINFSSDALDTYTLIETTQSIPNDFRHGALNQHTYYSVNTGKTTFLNHELTHLQLSSETTLPALAREAISGRYSHSILDGKVVGMSRESKGEPSGKPGSIATVSSILRPQEDLKTTIHTVHFEESELIVNLCFVPPEDLSVEALRNKKTDKHSRGSLDSEDAKMVLEVIDLSNMMMRVVPITPAGPERTPQSPANRLTAPQSSSVHMAALSTGYIPKVVRIVSVKAMLNGELMVLGEDGKVSIFEFDSKRLQSQLKQWNRIVGNVPNQLMQKKNPNEIRLTFQYNDGKRASGNPKFGEFDGKPHRGQSTFAGGQGGADTSGMGGAGGPSRLDLGEGPIFQVSDEIKQNVERSVLDASRAMAKQALAERLSAIDMSQFDSSRYDSMLSDMKAEIRQLRSILESAAAKGKERTWLKLRTSGELDDNRLVDGITGEKNVYKARGKQKPMDGSPQEKPKRMRFVMDVSGSMARFNGTDRRLERLLQCTLMIMESLKGFEHKYSYSIVGHSGDSPEIDLVDYGKPPQNKKERLAVLDKMTAHAAHCSSGDYTVKATELAIRNVVKEEADEYFVFVFSDANLGRYAIKPSSIKDELLRDRRVGAYILFIASAGDDAHRIRTELPLGRAHVCLDTGTLPATFKQIFASNAIQND